MHPSERQAASHVLYVQEATVRALMGTFIFIGDHVDPDEDSLHAWLRACSTACICHEAQLAAGHPIKI